MRPGTSSRNVLERFDAIIIGGGVAGSTAARILARGGWSVAVVEKSSFPRRKVCGEYLSSTNLDLFERLGILDDFLFFLHLSFDGPGDLFSGNLRTVQELVWSLRGFWLPPQPSDAAFPLRSELRALPSRAGITAAMTVVLFAASAFFWFAWASCFDAS